MSIDRLISTYEQRIINRHGYDKYGDVAIINEHVELLLKFPLSVVISRLVAVVEPRIRSRHGYDKHGDLEFIMSFDH